MYNIKQITDKNIWENFIKSQKYTPMTQSWQYGVFYKNLNEKYWVFGVYNQQKKLIGGSLVLSVHAKRGNFLFIPYGPLMATDDEKALEDLYTHIKRLAKKEDYAFIRVSPFIDDTEQNHLIYKNLGFRQAPLHILAETTWLLDLSTKNAEELLMDMNKNHRNLIRRCIRDGVKVEMYKDKKELEKFNRLIKVTAKRHNFTKFSDEYVENEFKAFAPDDALILHAYLPEDKLDASAVVYFYSDMAAYRHGASLMQNKKLPSSYLLQWTAIMEAQKRGIKYYNFWGIAPDDAPKSHPFKGITHFKKGFGGFQKDLLPAQDLVVSWKYYFNWIIETIRRKKRGF